MSKENPNQNYYKIGGRSQSDGPDRLSADEERQSSTKENGKASRKHDGDPNFIPGADPVGEKKK